MPTILKKRFYIALLTVLLVFSVEPFIPMAAASSMGIPGKHSPLLSASSGSEVLILPAGAYGSDGKLYTKSIRLTYLTSQKIIVGSKEPLDFLLEFEVWTPPDAMSARWGLYLIFAPLFWPPSVGFYLALFEKTVGNTPLKLSIPVNYSIPDYPPGDYPVWFAYTRDSLEGIKEFKNDLSGLIPHLMLRIRGPFQRDFIVYADPKRNEIFQGEVANWMVTVISRNSYEGHVELNLRTIEWSIENYSFVPDEFRLEPDSRVKSNLTVKTNVEIKPDEHRIDVKAFEIGSNFSKTKTLILDVIARSQSIEIIIEIPNNQWWWRVAESPIELKFWIKNLGRYKLLKGNLGVTVFDENDRGTNLGRESFRSLLPDEVSEPMPFEFTPRVPGNYRISITIESKQNLSVYHDSYKIELGSKFYDFYVEDRTSVDQTKLAIVGVIVAMIGVIVVIKWATIVGMVKRILKRSSSHQCSQIEEYYSAKN